MNVNSFSFILFFLPVCILYFLTGKKSASWQNLVLFLSSCIFYGYADLRALPILLGSIIITYLLGRSIHFNLLRNQRKATYLTSLGVWLGIGLLAYFKYLNFFITSVEDLLRTLGLSVSHRTLSVFLPIGISFFVFKLISYLVEIHRQRMKPENSWLLMANYIAFFPTILSGPIDRPQLLLEQMKQVHRFNYDDLLEGCKRILWGMFKKMCVADVLCGYTDAVFNNYTHHNATSLTISAVFYTFQLYADFSGYSDMAIGVGRIMGFHITENFKQPFSAVNITEYWKRWHITLTSWLTDYVFTPLNLRFRNMGMTGLNIAVMINLLVIGAWHGANWTFVLFGFYHGCMLVLNNLISKRRKKFEKNHHLKNNVVYHNIRVAKMLAFVTFGNIIFRSDSIAHFFGYLSQFSIGFQYPYVIQRITFIMYFPPLILMLLKEWRDAKQKSPLLLHSPRWYVQAVSMAVIFSLIILEGEMNGVQFIYFQF